MSSLPPHGLPFDDDDEYHFMPSPHPQQQPPHHHHHHPQQQQQHAGAGPSHAPAPPLPPQQQQPLTSVIAIAENSHYEIGIACMRMVDHSIELSGYCDDQAYSKTLNVLARFEPTILLFTKSSEEAVLPKIVAADFPLAEIKYVVRKMWNENIGLRRVAHYAMPQHVDVLTTDTKNKYLALGALAALIDTVEQYERTSLIKGTVAIKFNAVDGVMLLDPSTVANLELLRNHRTSHVKHSLFDSLNHTLTNAGARHLRSTILQPSTDLATISGRLDAVSELLQRDAALHDVRRVLPHFADSDKLLKHFTVPSKATGCARAKQSINAVLQLKTVLRAAPLLAAALTSNGQDAADPDGLGPLQNELLCKICENLSSSDLEELDGLISLVIDEDAMYAKRPAARVLESLFAVRPEVNAFLGVARQTLTASVQEMERLVQGYAEELGVDDMRLVYSDRRGYHCTVPASAKERLEQPGASSHRFIRIASQAKKTVACSTDALSQLSLRCKEMIGQLLMHTEKELKGLEEEVRRRLHVAFTVGESVALLDMLQSFATFTQRSGYAYARPKMASGAMLVLKESRHPLLEAIGEGELISNDVVISHSSHFQLITGPNMSGKSTYLRQVALIVLLAHMGCHVPAEAATIPLLQRVFTRIGASDSIEQSGSTFACEMRETTYILRSLFVG